MTPARGRRRTKTWNDSQPDLFIALSSDLPARDQQGLMESPFSVNWLQAPYSAMRSDRG